MLNGLGISLGQVLGPNKNWQLEIAQGNRNSSTKTIQPPKSTKTDDSIHREKAGNVDWTMYKKASEVVVARSIHRKRICERAMDGERQRRGRRREVGSHKNCSYAHGKLAHMLP